MRPIYFYHTYYPEWKTGGQKYLIYIYNVIKKSIIGIYHFGPRKNIDFINKFKILKIIYGLYEILWIPRKSILIMTNAEFLHFSLPLFLNKLWKKHFYFLVVCHLVRDTKPSLIRNKLESFFIKNSDKIITISETTKEKLIKYNLTGSDFEILTPGLDIDREKIAKKSFSFEVKKILYVGIVEERKGILVLIESLKYLKDINYILQIVGIIDESDEYYKLVRKKIVELIIEDKVIFLGKVSSEMLLKLYLNSDLFVFPSLWEGYGMVIAEAMTCGLPVIASDIPALEELIDDNLNGLLFKPGNKFELGEKMKEVLINEKLSRKLSDNAILKSKEFRNWTEVSWKFFEIINKFR